MQALAPAPHAILVVDDAPANLVAYRAVLESLGREVVTARSGREAIKLLALQPFALLLIDVRMPGLDGFSTVALLREQLRTVTPVIFITGASDDESMRRAYEFGAVDYLVKPVPPEILRGKVRNLLALYEQGIELERRAALLMEQHERILEADALLRRKDVNIGILAHDLRNPLAAIVTSANLLGRLPEVSDKALRIAERIDRSARRMTAMIRDILDYTRSRVGAAIPIKRQPTDLGALSRSVVDEIRVGYPSARIEVETAGALTGHWDASRIEQVLSNLIANAIQHGGPDVRLMASEETSENGVVVTVRSGGDPIPQELLPTLFDGFKKGGDPAHLGLGLFIVREIVHAHDGSIAVTSSVEGTMVTFRLPRGTTAEEIKNVTGEYEPVATTG
ncbi:MAG TPA: hybrid sensor histidine kinase/response regulator [Polyangia bacterium]|nr:hybrid sensor histidine kinase/response regulator [Polyangia bacterium]